MKRSELKQLIRETVEEVRRGYEPGPAQKAEDQAFQHIFYNFEELVKKREASIKKNLKKMLFAKKKELLSKIDDGKSDIRSSVETIRNMNNVISGDVFSYNALDKVRSWLSSAGYSHMVNRDFGAIRDAGQGLEVYRQDNNTTFDKMADQFSEWYVKHISRF